jgi:hypothetical protein
MTRVRYSYVSRARAVAADAVELWLEGGSDCALFVTRAGEAWVAGLTIACAPGEIRIPCPPSQDEDDDADEYDTSHAEEVLERLIEDAWRDLEPHAPAAGAR